MTVIGHGRKVDSRVNSRAESRVKVRAESRKRVVYLGGHIHDGHGTVIRRG
jgi:hypothetical protein